MKAKKALCVTLIASLALSACNNQVGNNGMLTSNGNQILNLKNNNGFTKADYRTDIFELDDIAVFDEYGKNKLFYLDSSKGLQLLEDVTIPAEALKDNAKFLEFMKANKDKLKVLATAAPLPDNSLAMHYDTSHSSIHWLAFNKDKTRWLEYGVDLSNQPQEVRLLQEGVVDSHITKDNLAVSFRDSGIEGETLIDISYSEEDMAIDLDGQPIQGLGKISYLARSEINAPTISANTLKSDNYQPKLIGVNGVLANNYIYSDVTSIEAVNFIRKLYSGAEIGKFTKHKEGFLDYLRNLSPIFGLILVTTSLSYIRGYFKNKGTIHKLEAKQAELNKRINDAYNKKSSEVTKRELVENTVIEKLPIVSTKGNSGPSKSLKEHLTLIDDETILLKELNSKRFVDYDTGINVEFKEDLIGKEIDYKLVVGIIDEYPITKKQYTAISGRDNITIKDIKANITEEIEFEKVVADSSQINNLVVNTTKSSNEFAQNHIYDAKKILATKYRGISEQEVIEGLSKQKLIIHDKDSITIKLPENNIRVPYIEVLPINDLRIDKIITNKIRARYSDPQENLIKKTKSADGKSIKYEFIDGENEIHRIVVDIDLSLFRLLENQVKLDFANAKSLKKYPLTAGIASAVTGTSAYLIWKDDFAKLGSWMFGGCDKFVCNSTFLYEDKSSESSVGMKADALYQQVPFNDGKSNYVLNIVQVFSQNCKQLIQTTSESQSQTLYAGTKETNVGKHYLISDVNNNLCSIGNMDMNLFIESQGAHY